MKKKILLVLFIILSVLVMYLFGSRTNSAPDFSSFSADTHGAGLFFDTLRHMGYPVGVGYRPLTERSDTNHVYIIIQPYDPVVSAEMAREMLEWVQAGGFLIFLHNSGPTIVERMLPPTIREQRSGDFTRYRYGSGQFVAGPAHVVTNRRLLHDPSPAAQLQGILEEWDAGRIWFTAYYHGIRPSETFFSSLPLVVRLVCIQSAVTVLLLLWHLGKRFGKPIPAYTETEREENEQVRALARLFFKTNKRQPPKRSR
jgi:hypothetical protein